MPQRSRAGSHTDMNRWAAARSRRHRGCGEAQSRQRRLVQITFVFKRFGQPVESRSNAALQPTFVFANDALRKAHHGRLRCLLSRSSEESESFKRVTDHSKFARKHQLLVLTESDVKQFNTSNSKQATEQLQEKVLACKCALTVVLERFLMRPACVAIFAILLRLLYVTPNQW